MNNYEYLLNTYPQNNPNYLWVNPSESPGAVSIPTPDLQVNETLTVDVHLLFPNSFARTATVSWGGHTFCSLSLSTVAFGATVSLIVCRTSENLFNGYVQLSAGAGFWISPTPANNTNWAVGDKTMAVNISVGAYAVSAHMKLFKGS